MTGKRRRVDPCRDRGGDGERGEQRSCAHEEVTADAHEAEQLEAVHAERCAGVAEAARQDDQEHRRGCDLREHGSPCRPGHAEVQAVHEHDLDREVQEVGAQCHGQWRARVLHPPQVAVAHEGNEHERSADRADPQVGHGVLEHGTAAAERDRRRACQRRDEHRRHQAQQAGEPQPLGANVIRGPPVSRADEERHPGRGGVGEEVADEECDVEDARRQRQSTEGGGAEVTHDRGVDEHVEGLDRQRRERGHGEAQDRAIPRLHERRRYR